MTTDLGAILFELYPDKAPITANNFLQNVKKGCYQNATFYRTVHPQNQPNDSIKIEVIQGGLWIEGRELDFPVIDHEPTNVTDILHENGVLSMARREPGTASSEFFICIGDQPELDFGGKRNPDGQGFAAFGRVIEGMEVVRRIQQQPAMGQTLEPRINIVNVEFVE